MNPDAMKRFNAALEIADRLTHYQYDRSDLEPLLRQLASMGHWSEQVELFNSAYDLGYLRIPECLAQNL